MAVLLLAEVTNGELAMDATAKAVTAAKAIGDVTVLCAGASAAAAGQAAAAIENAPLTVTVPNVEVRDGELNISFAATAGEPTLSGLVVRGKDQPTKEWQLVWSDEFEGGTIDDTKWSPDIWPPRKVNDE
ncbi:MAG: hypothetical protein OQK00_03740, partial [Rhodobacteraceae bacterium]|nr:hypothetical protein [Paracoccaceae bacterium]